MRRPVVSVEQTGMLDGRLHPKREGENNRRGSRRRRHCGMARRARHRSLVGALMCTDVLCSMKSSIRAFQQRMSAVMGKADMTPPRR